MSHDFNKSTMRVCRACLATDVRLYDMHQNRLMEAYERLIQLTEDLPHYLCSYCAVLLLKCDTFLIKCFRAQIILENAQFDNVELNMEYLKNIDRKINKFTIPYRLTEQLGISILHENTKNIDLNQPIYEIDECSNDSSVSETKHDDNIDTGTTYSNKDNISHHFEIKNDDKNVNIVKTVAVVDLIHNSIIDSMKSKVSIKEEAEVISDETELNKTDSGPQGEVNLYVSHEKEQRRNVDEKNCIIDSIKSEVSIKEEAEVISDETELNKTDSGPQGEVNLYVSHEKEPRRNVDEKICIIDSIKSEVSIKEAEVISDETELNETDSGTQGEVNLYVSHEKEPRRNVDEKICIIDSIKSEVSIKEAEVISDETELNETDSGTQGEVNLYVSHEKEPRRNFDEKISSAIDKSVNVKNQVKNKRKPRKLLNNSIRKPLLLNKSVVISKKGNKILRSIINKESVNQTSSNLNDILQKHTKNIDSIEPIHEIDECSNDSSVSETKHDVNIDTGTTNHNKHNNSHYFEIKNEDKTVNTANTVAVGDLIHNSIIDSMKSKVSIKEEAEVISDETELNKTDSRPQGEVNLYVSHEKEPTRNVDEKIRSAIDKSVNVKIKGKPGKLLNNSIGRKPVSSLLLNKSVVILKKGNKILTITNKESANQKSSKLNDAVGKVIDLTNMGDSVKYNVYFDKKHNNGHNEKFVCGICNCKFSKQIDFLKHKMNHKIKYSCKKCGFTTSYAHRRDYFMHVRFAHNSRVEWIRCEMCGVSFTGPAGLRLHESIKHKEMASPEFFCLGCDTQFFCLLAYKVHQGTDGLCDKQAKYCVRCGMAFETEELLKAHEIEQRKPRDVFNCKDCVETFSNHGHFLWHRRIHRNKMHPQRLFKCTECGCFLERIASVKKHISKAHKVQMIRR